MINLDILLDVSEIGGKEVNQDRKVYISDKDSGKALLLVADGVGGSKQGEIAAQIMVDTALALWEKRNEFDSAKSYLEKLSVEANNKIKEQIEKSIKTASTLCAVAIWPGECLSVHAGDSRIYHFNSQGAVKHSRDHSLAYSKFLMGEISEEELATHPTQTQLLSCVDGGDPSFEFTDWELSSGDVLVACTDGFWEIYTNDSLQDLISNPDRNMLFVNHFDSTLEKRPKHDNTTAIITRVEFGEPSSHSKEQPKHNSGNFIDTNDSDPENKNENSKTLILIVLVIIVALAAIYMLSQDEQATNNEPEVKTMPSPQDSDKQEKAENSNPEETNEDSKSNRNDSDSDSSDKTDSESSNSNDHDENTTNNTRESNPNDSSEDDPDEKSDSLPDLNDGLDSSEGVEIEIVPGKDIKQQVRDSLVKKEVISKDSDVVLSEAKTDQYSTVRDLQIKVKGIPVFGAQAKLIKTERGFEIVTGKLANVQAPTVPPKRNFSQCLSEHSDLALANNTDAKGKLYLDAKTGGYLWMSIGIEKTSRAEFRILFYDVDCSIKMKEPLLISQGGK